MWKKYCYIIISSLFVIFLVIVACELYFVSTYKTSYAQMIFQQADECGIEPELVFAIIKEESGFNPDSVSKAGAVGLMQIMPLTAKSVEGVAISNLKEEVVNIKIGCWYLKYLMNKFESVELTLIAYNAGEGNLIEWLKTGQVFYDELGECQTPFSQTNAYVKKVLDSKKVYKKIIELESAENY